MSCLTDTDCKLVLSREKVLIILGKQEISALSYDTMMESRKWPGIYKKVLHAILYI